MKWQKTKEKEKPETKTLTTSSHKQELLIEA